MWWGIFILDRTISLGSKKRFSAMEPSENDILPVHDDAWVSYGAKTRRLLV